MNNQKQYKILISGDELVELKRHAHEIPECPGLDKRIQKYQGKKPFLFTYHEIGWLVAVLDAVLTDPNGYPCVEYNPWKLEYVPVSDERCKTCKQLYDRLNEEEDKIVDLQQRKNNNTMDYDKMAITLTDSQRELMLKYESCFADHRLFRKISLAVKEGDDFEIYLDDEGLEDLMDQVSDFTNLEKDEGIQIQLDHLNDCLVEFYNDIFDDDGGDYFECSDETGAVCVVKVALAYSKKIWRNIAIQDGHTLHDLHNIIFEAFDRDDEHMYSFFFPHSGKKLNPRKIRQSSDEYTHPYACEDREMFDSGSEAHDASAVTIESLDLTEGQVFYYLFDFGDEWWHEITVEKIDGTADDEKYPRIIERKGDSPEQYPDPDEDEDY